MCFAGDLSAKLQELRTELEELKQTRMAQEREIPLETDPAVQVRLAAIVFPGSPEAHRT